MQRLILKSRIGADGVLRVTVPMGQADADREVQLTIEPLSPATKSTKTIWTFCKRRPAPGREISSAQSKGNTKSEIPCDALPPGLQRLDRSPAADKPRGDAPLMLATFFGRGSLLSRCGGHAGIPAQVRVR
jgi:hypothetical protein